MLAFERDLAAPDKEHFLTLRVRGRPRYKKCVNRFEWHHVESGLPCFRGRGNSTFTIREVLCINQLSVEKCHNSQCDKTEEKRDTATSPYRKLPQFYCNIFLSHSAIFHEFS
jgi:hypothetical protein